VRFAGSPSSLGELVMRTASAEAMQRECAAPIAIGARDG